jgi:hypothetical protein
VQIQASADLKHWTNATAPLPGNNFTLSDWAPVELFYRLKQATNQIDLGKGYYDSLCVSASAGGNTAVITHDFDSVYLTLYRRDKSVSHYTIDEMIVQDVNYGAGYAWADNNRIVIAYVPSYTNRVFVDEFALTPTSISRVSEIITGDDQSRTPDVLAMSDGTVIVCAAQQCGGMEAWMLHRLPTTGVWKDDGKLQIAPCAVGGEPAGYLKLYETPWNHHPGIAGVHDSWGVLQVFEYQYFGINSTIQAVTNFVVASNRRVNDVMLDGLMAVHGEIPPLKVVGDPVSKTVIFSYGNEQRSYIYGTPIGDFSCTQVAVTAMFQTATNYEKRLVFQSSGRVERVDEVQNLNVSNGVPILTYIPLEAGYCTNWPTLSVATRSINGADVSQEIYCQQYNTLYQHRNYCDLIGVRDDSHIIVILGP